MDSRTAAADGGETLVETLLSIMIMGIATAAVLGLAQTGIGASDMHHKQSVAGNILANFSEFMLDETQVPYTACPSAVSTYGGKRSTFAGLVTSPTSKVYEPDAGAVATPRYALSIDGIMAGDFTPTGSPTTVSYTGSCTAAGTSDSQQLKLTVASTDGLAAESTVIVKRRP